MTSCASLVMFSIIIIIIIIIGIILNKQSRLQQPNWFHFEVLT